MIRLRTARGFTLIEVMVTLVLLLGVGVAVVQALTSSYATKTRVTQLNERYHEGRQVMVRVARELRTAFLRSEVPEEKREEDPAVLTRFLGTEDEISFASTSHLRLQEGAPESDQAEIAYFLRSSDHKSEYKGKTLFRRESRRLDDKTEQGGTIWPVIDGVKEFQIEYWDDAKEIGDDAWKRDWDSDENDLLPARVRITLELEAPDDGTPIRFVTQAAPRIRRPINVIEAHVKPKTSQGQNRKRINDAKDEQ